MILDLKAIHKLTPPGMLNLAVLGRLIAHLLGLVETAIACEQFSTRQVLKLSRLIGRLSKQDRDNRNYNLNLKIKAWVLADRLRALGVRAVIGEVAIRRWQRQYADLQNGHVPAIIRRKSKSKRAPKLNTRPYAWKRFVLGDVYMFGSKPQSLSLFPAHDRNLSTNLNTWIQPREKRILKPVEFWPYELAPDYKPESISQKENKDPPEPQEPPPKSTSKSRRPPTPPTKSKPP